MNKLIGFCVLFSLYFFPHAYAQPTFSYKQADWQQRVDYKIQVSLDDKNHLLNGNVYMVYHNESPDPLTEIVMHIWPNAYKNNHTAFAIQKNEDNDGKFIFADQSDKGYMDQLSFKINGANAAHNAYGKWEDVVTLTLDKPLQPGDSLQISTPFRVKIPGSFSRLGHEGQAYQISQWYPKPAVYDINGWNAMPYLDQGEFYSEFGRFEVKITVPENYVVAATGELQEESEKDFLRERINNPIDPTKTIATSEKLKTITFVQDNVHDFAWFASKTFNIERGKVTLNSGKVVETFVYASQKKINYCRYINDALTFYSANAGEYPYKYCSVVLGSLKAGGGMEYPMITVCDFLSEEVIVHEVGHNWFYGILGSNERTYPWMDESINSFFEGETVKGVLKQETLPTENINTIMSNDGSMKAIATHAARKGTDQAPGDESEVFTAINYGTMVYGKGTFLFKHLQAYLGDELFYTCFRTYFDKWKFKHPLPDDMQEVFEKTSGKNLSWFFRDLMFTRKTLDYALGKISITGNQAVVSISNRGQIQAPVPIDIVFENKVIKTIWVDGFRGDKSLNIEIEGNFDRIQIDAKGITTDSRPYNNNYFNHKTFKYAESIKLSLLTSVESRTVKKLNVFPAYGFNLYNKSMIGAGFSNISFPGKRTEYLLLPLFSPTTSDINGYAELVHTKPLINKKAQSIETGIKAARFAFNNFDLFSYNKIAPYANLHFSNPAYRGSRQADLKLRYVFMAFTPQFNLNAEKASFPSKTFIYEKNQHFVRLEYTFQKKTAVRPEKVLAFAETGFYNIGSKQGNFVKMQASYEKLLNYKKEKKGLTLRAFAGGFLKPADNSSGIFNFGVGSYAKRFDYLMDQSMMGRSADFGLFENQVLNTETRQKFTGSLGSADKYMLGLNLISTLPGKIPFKIYADVITFNGIKNYSYLNAQMEVISTNLFYQAGISLVIIPDIFEIHVPLLQSEVVTKIQALQNIGAFHERITFVLNLNKLDPRYLAKTLKLF